MCMALYASSTSIIVVCIAPYLVCKAVTTFSKRCIGVSSFILAILALGCFNLFRNIKHETRNTKSRENTVLRGSVEQSADFLFFHLPTAHRAAVFTPKFGDPGRAVGRVIGRGSGVLRERPFSIPQNCNEAGRRTRPISPTHGLRATCTVHGRTQRTAASATIYRWRPQSPNHSDPVSFITVALRCGHPCGHPCSQWPSSSASGGS
jgi:hypothetical protein